MLDRTTKKRIDDLRDTLVGKLPDPKAQIEQITIALIYKFMNDMDQEALELGGDRKFFSGDYEKYGWDELFDPKVKGEDQLKLYVEAIESMELNPNLPTLFRDIFRNAFLPYRDPETLRQFLKIINDFTYDHSEKLGDAFEYLLSVMGSQGDAGQFRTPRHIIDFMVEIIDPQKNETILDPACGTAGFLISSYKHIIKHNSSNFSQRRHSERSEESVASAESLPLAVAKKEVSVTENVLENPIRYKGDKLTADERKKLVQNITGYDISPDMVRMSLVNMYLHGFPDPNIEEYDTLTSEKKWGQLADVILANPPFMSPKGGIRPHQQFSIQSNRSEVLFVDYIAEHLSMNGRAALIVPEGIIFQSATAYKKLRKMLVEENFLVGVISLPAGVFNPYSGVKTSILWMDKELAKKTGRILFVKVENDGFDLGAQRKPIKENDLPEAFEVVKRYERLLQDGANTKELNEWADKLEQGKRALLVKKEKIAENGEYNLSGERYAIQKFTSSYFDLARLDQVCDINRSTVDPLELFGTTDFIYIDISSVSNGTGKVDLSNKIKTTEAPSRARRVVKNDDVVISTVRPNLKAFGYLKNLPSKVLASTGFAVLTARENLNPKFLYHLIRSNQAVDQMINRMVRGSYPSINQKDVSELEIPVPPLPVQEEIVAEIESYQKIIDGARQVVENYKPRIDIDPDWPMVEFKDAPFEIIDGDRGKNYPKSEEFMADGHCLFLNTGNVLSDGFNFLSKSFISKNRDQLLRKGKLNKRDVVLTTRGTVGNTALYHEGVNYDHIRINSGMLIFRPDESKVLSDYLFFFFQSENFQSQVRIDLSGTAQPQLPIRSLNHFLLPLPELEIQNQIVAQINQEKRLVYQSYNLILIFEQKIKDRIAKVWGEKKEEAPKQYAAAEETVSMAAED